MNNLSDSLEVPIPMITKEGDTKHSSRDHYKHEKIGVAFSS